MVRGSFGMVGLVMVAKVRVVFHWVMVWVMVGFVVGVMVRLVVGIMMGLVVDRGMMDMTMTVVC